MDNWSETTEVDIEVDSDLTIEITEELEEIDEEDIELLSKRAKIRYRLRP